MSSSSEKKTVLVVGATGNTGHHVVRMLLQDGHRVKAVVRSQQSLSEKVDIVVEGLEVTEATLLDLPTSTMESLVQGCDAVVSCLGHRDIYGHPRQLVTEAMERLCRAIVVVNNNKKTKKLTKVILMGSNGVANPNGADDVRPFMERCILSLIRYLVPPHVDNETAAQLLYDTYPKEESSGLEWCVVRPDDLIDTDVVTLYDLHEKPLKGLFGGGTASRRNVAHAIVQLIVKESLWEQWRFLMPVVNDKKEDSSKLKDS